MVFSNGVLKDRDNSSPSMSQHRTVQTHSADRVTNEGEEYVRFIDAKDEQT